jgi:hypothetical protein
MPFMNKVFLLAVVVLGLTVGAAVAATTGSDDPVATIPASSAIDVKGPCDEAEHANDPECAGAQVPEDDVVGDDGARADDDNDAAGVDISGPCDEAEHANDPRCTGVGAGTGDDDRGEVEDREDDNSGPSSSSGPGGGDDDNSGPSDDSGSGSSGSGHSGGDDDGGNSGSGGDDD